MSTVDDAAEIFQAWLDGRRFNESPAGLSPDERGLIAEAQGSAAPMDSSAARHWDLPPGTTVGQFASQLLRDPSRLRNVEVLKNTTIDPRIVEAGLEPVVGRLNNMLAEEIGRVSIPVKATWKLLAGENGHPRLWLVLSDDLGRVVASFDPRPDLSVVYDMRQRMNRLWGDLLQMRSHKLVAEMKANASSAENL